MDHNVFYCHTLPHFKAYHWPLTPPHKNNIVPFSFDTGEIKQHLLWDAIMISSQISLIWLHSFKSEVTETILSEGLLYLNSCKTEKEYLWLMIIRVSVFWFVHFFYQSYTIFSFCQACKIWEMFIFFGIVHVPHSLVFRLATIICYTCSEYHSIWIICWGMKENKRLPVFYIISERNNKMWCFFSQ